MKSYKILLALTLAATTVSFAAHAAGPGKVNDDSGYSDDQSGAQPNGGDVNNDDGKGWNDGKGQNDGRDQNDGKGQDDGKGGYDDGKGQDDGRNQNDGRGQRDQRSQRDQRNQRDQRGQRNQRGQQQQGGDLCQGNYVGNYADGTPVQMVFQRINAINVVVNINAGFVQYIAQGTCQDFGGQAQFNFVVLNALPIQHQGIISVGPQGRPMMNGSQLGGLPFSLQAQ